MLWNSARYEPPATAGIRRSPAGILLRHPDLGGGSIREMDKELVARFERMAAAAAERCGSTGS
jgi:hypothetical protein